MVNAIGHRDLDLRLKHGQDEPSLNANFSSTPRKSSYGKTQKILDFNYVNKRSLSLKYVMTFLGASLLRHR